MYVGVLCVMLGWAVLFQTAVLFLYTLFAVAIFHSFVLFLEEPGLRRKFGEDYDAYRADVNRWLPRLRRSRSGRLPDG